MNERKSRGLILASVMIFVTIMSLYSSITLLRADAFSDSTSWYTTVNGNLGSDTYLLYPFEKNSVNYGFSKYGELIGIPANGNMSDPNSWVGMAYDSGAVDPFCPRGMNPNNPQIPMASWINGWYIVLSYIDPHFQGNRSDRNLYAFAMFADGGAWGGDWQYAANPFDGNGGRKTNGVVTTDNLKILYNGPREFVAQSVNHIFDKEGSTTWSVVDLTLTMIFDKVQKEIILLKDVKLTLPKAHIQGKLDVMLSNREEYDLGPFPDYASYAHFYEEVEGTCLTPDWSMSQILMREHIDELPGQGTGNLVYDLSMYPDYPIADGFMKVYVNGVFVDPITYAVNYTLGTVTFNLGAAPKTTDIVKFVYKYIFKIPEPPECGCGDKLVTHPPEYPVGSGNYYAGLTYWDGKYDLAQVISSNGAYVAWAAFWPPTSSYTVDGLGRGHYMNTLVELREDSLQVAPWESPLIIGQWDFLMDHKYVPMFRGVEVKGIANRHNADDPQAYLEQWSSGSPVIDTEAYYQLDQIFQPWDLNSAVEKNTMRWEQFYTLNSTDIIFAQSHGYFVMPLNHYPVVYASTWEEYNSFSERVIWDGQLQYPYRQLLTAGFTPSYELMTDYGYGYIYIPLSDLPAVGTTIEVQYSTGDWYSNTYPVHLNTARVNLTSSQLSSGYGIWDLESNPMGYEDYLGAIHNFQVDWSKIYVTGTNTTDGASSSLTGNLGLEFQAKDFTVFKEDIAKITAYDLSSMDVDHTHDGLKVKLDAFKLKWEITPPAYMGQHVDLHISKATLDVNYNITVVYNATYNPTNPYTVYISFTINQAGKTLYCEDIPGRFEWGIVGRDITGPADSAGLSAVSAAFKDKEVEYLQAGEDMYSPDPTTQMPWVVAKLHSGDTFISYQYNNSANDQRVGLKDHWCGDMWDPTIWANPQEPIPIASSNMIGVGGPLINQFSYYGNDLLGTSAFYAQPWFTSYTPWSNKIVALTCWNGTKKGYSDTNTTGYAVISTFEDLNGTVGFLVWGNWGRDTNYASKWFQDDGIYEFQHFPCGATSIVLKITYTNTTEGFKPTAYKVIEVLGTVSETTVYDGAIVKGGIHDP